MINFVNAQTQPEGTVIQGFDKEFARLHNRSCALIETVPAKILYEAPHAKMDIPSKSVGEYVLKSAGAVEQTFGGLNSNLWDDPFEWTLPENLSTRARVMEYLSEVEATRRHAFDGFSGDGDLFKTIMFPSGDMQPLIHLFVKTLVRAHGYQGRAIAIRGMLSNV